MSPLNPQSQLRFNGKRKSKHPGRFRTSPTPPTSVPQASILTSSFINSIEMYSDDLAPLKPSNLNDKGQGIGLLSHSASSVQLIPPRPAPRDSSF
ncbi:hypothetical protein VNI00_015687 [Paramarasmius palmivorus]|uniref:Uncharacterized protein n=1 Tax=Paramarasmius palmivorus TaxID=297713 RepID=A0AAW0BIA3_9AGAR